MHSLCRDCTLSSHRLLPFHRLEKWNGYCFLNTSLFEQGFVLWVGHGGSVCPTSQQDQGPWEDIPAMYDDGSLSDDSNIQEDNHDWQQEIVITDTAGIFKHRISWCSCDGPPDQPMQLFQQQLFPASHHRVKSTFTFNVLDHFYLDAMECKTAAMSFWKKLRRLTNNRFPSKVHVSVMHGRCEPCADT